jgi:hypothetical protein
MAAAFLGVRGTLAATLASFFNTSRQRVARWAGRFQPQRASAAPSDAGKRAVEAGVKTSEYAMAKGAGTGNILPESGIVPE